MTLKTYLDDRKETQAAFAERVRTTPATISRLIKGNFQPSLELAGRIANATGGAVPMQSWITSPPQRAEGLAPPSSPFSKEAVA